MNQQSISYCPGALKSLRKMHYRWDIHLWQLTLIKFRKQLRFSVDFLINEICYNNFLFSIFARTSGNEPNASSGYCWKKTLKCMVLILQIAAMKFSFLNHRYSVLSAGIVIRNRRITNALMKTRLSLVVPLVIVACSYIACEQRSLSTDVFRLRKHGMYLAGRMWENQSARLVAFIVKKPPNCTRARFKESAFGSFCGQLENVSRTIWGLLCQLGMYTYSHI